MDDQKQCKEKYPLEFAIWDILHIWVQTSLVIAMACMHSALAKSEPFNLKTRKHAMISYYLPSQAEVIIEDTIETLKQRYNSAWTTGFWRQNKNVEFNTLLKSKKSNLMHFPGSLRTQLKIHLTNTSHLTLTYEVFTKPATTSKSSHLIMWFT